jgi:hypothetical protein
MDLRLITILPPQSTQGVQQPSNAQNSSGGLTNLSGIPSGTILSGFIINRDSNGNPVLRTESGDITFASNFFLKIGSEVQIRVEQSVGNTLARLLTVDGQPPEVAQARSSFATTPDVILSQALASRSTVSDLLLQTEGRAPAAPTAGSNNASSIATSNDGGKPAITISGTLISPPPQTSGNPPPSFPAGTELLLKLVALAPQTGGTAGATTLQPAANPASYAAYARISGNPLAPPASNVPSPAVPPAATTQQTGNTSSSAVTTGNNTTISASPPVTGAPVSQTSVTSLTIPATADNAALIAQNTTGSTAGTASLPATSSNQLQVQPGQPAPSQTISAGSNTTVLSPVSSPSTTTVNTPQLSVVQPALLQTGQVISGTVIGNEPTGEALVQTSIGIIRLQPGTSLPTGSSISFELTKATIPQTQINAALAADTAASFGEIARQWTSLAQILALLSGRDSSGGIDFIQPNMPWLRLDGAPPPQSLITPQNMTTGLMFFLAALKGEDFKNWLGRHNTQWLENNGHAGLLKKASAEFLTMARQYNDTSPNQPWQTLIFPVAVEGELQQVRWFLKRDRKQGGNKQSSDGDDTRFIVEVDLTQLGEIQMDGFIRKPAEQHVHFDLVIRSKTPLPRDIQQDILAIYTATGELTGYQGNLQFQSVVEFPVNPMEEISQRPHNNVVV